MRTRIVFAAVTFCSTLSALVWIGCGDARSCEDNLSCPKEGDDGAADAVALDASGNEASSPSDAAEDADASAAEDATPDVTLLDANVDGCAPGSAPKDDACVLQDAIGVFVAPGESDSSPGTADAPVGTIAKAFEIARATNRASIFVCGGTYAQGASFTQGSGVNVFGGLSCPPIDAGGGPTRSWSWTGAQTKIAPTANGIVLVLDRLSGSSNVVDLEIQAPSGSAPGATSIAAFVRSCPDVRFDRVVLRAGDGIEGTKGADGGFANTAPTVGNNASGATGGGAVTCTCAAGGSTTGGSGGGGGLGASGGGNGTPNLDGGAPKDGVGGTTACTAGHEGANGRDGDGGSAASGAVAYGSISFDGWTPNGGATAGASGAIAQGGGGGGGVGLGSGGGGGGCGGCGGQNGTFGGPGGSSFALLVYQSNVSLDSCTLFAGTGGAGGAGGGGQVGRAGAGGGAGACGGGSGGRGGGGGGGGGGTGGLSIAIGYAGVGPTMNGTTLQIAGAGAGGEGGVAGGTSNGGQQGKAGVAVQSLSLP